MRRATYSLRHLVAAVALAALLPACGDPSPAPRPSEDALSLSGPRGPRDVLLVTVDTLRYDGTGFSGRGAVTTPAADALARDGLVFDFAHAHSVVTLPSHASMLTGLNPHEHGIRDNAGFVLDASLPTMATLFAAEGYRTAAFVSSFTLDRRYGLDRGFEHYDDEYEGFQRHGFTPPERPGDRTVARALDWWRAHRGERRFMWVHTYTPHFPYEPSEPHASAYAERPYYGDAAMADAELAPLLDAVSAGDDADTIVVYTSDHGEGLGEHGEQTHGLFAYEATLHVPLVIRATGLIPPGRTDSPARHVDLLPTVLDLCGMRIPGGLSGRPLFLPPDGNHDFATYFEALSPFLNRGWAPLFGRIEGRTKSIDLPIPELYDLAEDPGESRNLARSRPRQLQAAIERLPDERLDGFRRAAIDREQEERLRSLGYVSGGGGDPTADPFDVANDPKNLVEVDQVLDRALSLYREGRLEQAVALMEELVARHPRMPLGYAHLAFFYTDLGRLDRAVDVLQRAVSLGVSNESIRRKLALALLERDAPERGLDVLSPDADSVDPETQSVLGRLEAVLGRFEQARARFERALAIDPTYPSARVDLGTLELMQGRFDAARTHIEAALARDPYLAEAWNALGGIRMHDGDADGAIEAWRKAIDIDPRLPDALYNLGLALGRRGRNAEAAGFLSRYAELVEGDERRQAEAMLRSLKR